MDLTFVVWDCCALVLNPYVGTQNDPPLPTHTDTKNTHSFTRYERERERERVARVSTKEQRERTERALEATPVRQLKPSWFNKTDQGALNTSTGVETDQPHLQLKYIYIIYFIFLLRETPKAPGGGRVRKQK